MSFPSLGAIHSIVFDFDGVFTDNAVFVGQDGKESVRCDRRDGLAFDFLRVFKEQGKLSAECFVLSKESNPVVLARTTKLRLKCYSPVRDKLAFVTQHLSDRFPRELNPFKGLVYLGNDLNDVPVMRKAGFSVAPSDAHPTVRALASLVLPETGGNGFVRAFIERLLEIEKLTDEELDELVSDR